MIILDLDDTIFLTSSMNPQVFDSAIKILIEYYQEKEDQNISQIIKELWSLPIDQVITKYQTPQNIVEKFYDEISKIDYTKLKIKPFPDYKVIQELKSDKILVTTGLSELQNAKIAALGIKEDFLEIHIDDPRDLPRFGKYEIFSSIMSSYNLNAHHIWVIGDNPNSELRAAHQLGMYTIQRYSASKKRADFSKEYIQNFYELNKITHNMEQ